MLINDVEAKTGKNDVIADIIDISEPREFERDGKSGRVATATIKDESGIIKLTLWNEQIDQISIGDRIEVINAWCDEWKDEKKLSTGKYGKIKIIDGNEKISHFDIKKNKKVSDDELSKDDVVYPEEFLDADENI
jgi:replication factor A1